MPITSRKLQLRLHDVYDESSTVIDAEVEIGQDFIAVRFLGYGDHNSVDGEGTPILIENQGGVPKVVLWSDINEEDPTHRISLECAAESRRTQP